jgi:uncharacterized protein YdhG (YjbR/CyaY superfamily)
MPSKKPPKSDAVFSEEERAAMRELAEERKTAARRGAKASEADGEADVLAKIAQMSAADRALAERIHALVKAVAPALTSRTWYGMPAYARDGNVVCFFQAAGKFKARYGTLGFSDKARLDEGEMWPTYFALKTLTPAVEKRIGELIRRAAG